MSINMNSNSYDFPLSSNSRLNSAEHKKKGIKVFSSIKSGANKEFPTYLRIPALSDNPLSYVAKFNKSNNLEVSQYKIDNKDFMINHLKMVDALKKDSLKSKDHYMSIPGYSELDFKEKREKRRYYQASQNNDELKLSHDLERAMSLRESKLNFKLSKILSGQHKSTFSPIKHKITSNIKNTNDYSIAEGDVCNSNRIITLPRKNVLNFDCINYKYNEITPDSIVKNALPEFTKK